MTHRIYEVPGDGPTIVALHPAGVTPEKFAALVGPVPGYRMLYPEAASGLRWSHLNEADAPFLLELGGDYLVGMSSGAFMGAEMLVRRNYKAAALVAGGFIKSLRPRPTPLVVIHGTEDKQVAYGGSTYVHGALETAIAMRKLLGVTSGPVHSTIPNKNKADGCSAYADTWGGNKVKLLTIVNGGHQYPCGTRTVWQPPNLGRVCRDFDATIALSEFFRANP